MFALIHKNEVISGPRDWDRAFFTFLLNSKNVHLNMPIPRAPLDNEPYHIDTNTKIVRAEIVQGSLNPLVEYYQGPTWELFEDKVLAHYATIDTPIEFARNNFKELVAAKRYEKEIKGIKTTIQETEVTLDTSRDGRNIFIQKYSLMQENTTVNWKFPEGWLTITKAELGQCVAAGVTYIQSCFDWEKSYDDLINAATTKAELLQIEQDIKDEDSSDLNRAANVN
jgi:hypothetical protein